MVVAERSSQAAALPPDLREFAEGRSARRAPAKTVARIKTDIDGPGREREDWPRRIKQPTPTETSQERHDSCTASSKRASSARTRSTM